MNHREDISFLKTDRIKPLLVLIFCFTIAFSVSAQDDLNTDFNAQLEFITASKPRDFKVLDSVFSEFKRDTINMRASKPWISYLCLYPLRELTALRLGKMESKSDIFYEGKRLYLNLFVVCSQLLVSVENP